MSKYKVWNKEDSIITPIGEILSPAQWIARFPVAGVLDTVISGGTINGAEFGVYDQMVEMYGEIGCDFSECKSQQEHLDKIEEFQKNQHATDEIEAYTDQSRIADALEDLVVLQLTNGMEE